MNDLLLLSFLGLLLSITSCRTEDMPSAPCANAGSFVKQAKKAVGQIYYDSTQNSYYIRVPNSFDSYDIGYTCNLRPDYQKGGLKVQFTGSYYDYDKPVMGLAGNKYYYLSLESVSL